MPDTKTWPTQCSRVFGLSKRRTNPYYLSDGEASRERKRTEHFVRSLADQSKDVFNFTNRLCDSCGVPLQSDSWFCKKCNICFCYQCGKDFSQIQEKIFPDCPICDEKLELGPGLELIHDKHKLLKYLTSTKLEFQSEDDLIRKASQLFKQEISYMKQVWFMVKEENPTLLSEITPHLASLQRKSFRPLDDSLMEYTPETQKHNIPNIVKAKSKNEEKAINLKDMKPVDGEESEWKQGKMKPVEQNKYRSSFEE